MWLFGLLLEAVAIGLYFARRSQQSKLHLLEITPTSTVEHLRTLAQSMSESLGQGALSFVTEVVGKVECASPLSAELSHKPCVYYSMQVEREFEHTVISTDAQGRRQRQVQRARENVSSNQRSTPFFVVDATGKIQVNPQGAEFIAETSVSRFEPGAGPGQSGGTLRIGGFALDLAGLGGDRRTLGYHFSEEIIPLDRDVYVLGAATDRYGELQIEAPPPSEKEGRFIISLKSEAQLVRELESRSQMMFYGAIACAVLGVGLLVAGLF